ncbi:hypothetical protein C4B60_16200 [Jeotgalibacillus proteolyticus]|uniref:Uncharacterized protein n=1 Tax=Jeotgalibacillus proteolyticus TaxID=2082395 RepID=A0A2S5G8N3_9BACL|nr:hypothetical protein C4B60_16200 [Jeotgalibacillus proteolyticus]
MKKYILNLTALSNGYFEVHEEGCTYGTRQKRERLGYHSTCASAVRMSKVIHPFKKINGCIYCSYACHTT